MNRAAKLLPIAVIALAFLTLGCAMPLPAAELTATAESQPPPPVEVRSGGGGVQAKSAGSLNLTSDDGDADAPALAVAATSTPVPTATATRQPSQAASTPEPVSQPENYASDLLAALNAARTQNGLPALTPNASLNAAAAGYAQYMGQANFFGHFGPDGSAPSSRIAAAGFKGQYKGETLTAGQGSPSAALSAFLNSSAHLAILMDRGSVAVGVGYYYAPGSTYKHYWTVVLANP